MAAVVAVTAIDIIFVLTGRSGYLSVLVMSAAIIVFLPALMAREDDGGSGGIRCSRLASSFKLTHADQGCPGIQRNYFG